MGPRIGGVPTTVGGQHSGFRKFLVVRRHRGNELLLGHLAGLRILAGLDDNHESHLLCLLLVWFRGWVSSGHSRVNPRLP